jgi:hypothetical protein
MARPVAVTVALLVATVAVLALRSNVSGLDVRAMGAGDPLGPAVDAGTATCGTDDEGHCSVGHRLGRTPSAVVVTLSAPVGGTGALPYQLATDRYTANDFRLRALASTGEVYSGLLTVSYAAYAGEPDGGAPPGTSTIEDTSEGAGDGQVAYSANWHACTMSCAKAADQSYRWTSSVGATATIRFTGTQITVFGIKEPWANIASATIDDGAAVEVDFYSADATDSVAVFVSPMLGAGSHALVLTATDRRNTASRGGSAITFDRALISTGASPTPMSSTPPAPTSTPTPPTTTALTTGSSTTQPAAAPAPSGFWLSGGSVDTNRLSAAVEWGNFRGRPVTFAVAYTTRTAGWDELVRSHAVSGQAAAHNDKSMTLLIQTPPFPENVGASYSALVAGAYDAYWRQVGTLLKARQDQGYPPAIVSIGWEMNGTYMYWGGGSAANAYNSPAQYVAGYQRIVAQLRATYPAVQTAWVINAHSTPASITTDTFTLYPGDEWVTYMGTDDYDHYPPARTKAAFDARANADAGMSWLANHARAHGKQIVLPEWGVAPGSGSNGGGDNPDYIQWMFETFQAWHAAGLLKGEFYFADPVGGGNVDSDLLGGSNPAAAERYRSLW